MKSWNLEKCMSNFEVDTKSLDIGDNITITYKGNFTPIKINGVDREELKQFKGSYCIYEMDESEWFDYQGVEMLVVEEYSDSPYSIYINTEGILESSEYGEITTIEIGTEIVIHIAENRILGYDLLKQD